MKNLLLISKIIEESQVKLTKTGLGCANFGGVGSDPKLIGKGATEKESF